MQIKKFIFILTPIISLFFFMACTNNSTHCTNLNSRFIAKTIFNKDHKEVTSITYQLNKVSEVKDKYLYLKGGKLKVDIIINNTDTIKYNNIQLVKKPFSNALLLEEKQLDFKLIPLSYDTLKSVQIKLHKRSQKKFALIKKALIVDEVGFNKLFKNENNLNAVKFPLISINTSSTIYDLEQTGTFTLNENPLDSSNLIKSSCSIKLRGNTSKTFKKKGFKLELTDTINRNKALLGMPAEHDWVLHGPIKDISLFRNKFAYDLARSVDYYAPRCEFCELVINNEYLGVYLLTESIKKDKNRVKVVNSKGKLQSYIIKIDRGSDLLFASLYKSEIETGWQSFFYPVYPKNKNLSSNHRKIIHDDFKKIEKSLLTDSMLSYINTASFINYFIVNELSRNIDAYRLSTFMHKNIGEKLQLGPIWDFNYSLGLNKERDGYLYNGWVYQGEAIPFWWYKLVENHEFKKQLNQRWFELRKTELSIESLHKSIDEYNEFLEPVLDRNFTRWDVFNSNLWVRQHSVKNYQNEVDLIKEWLDKRVLWMDKNLAN